MARSGDIASTQDRCYDGDVSIEDQVGFYGQPKQPHLGDINARAGELPAAADSRLTDIKGND